MRVLCLLLTLVSPAAAESPRQPDGQLSRETNVRLARATRLTALIRFGYENRLCLGIENPDPAMLTETVRLNGPRLTVEAALRQILPEKHVYELSEQDGLVLIRRADVNRATWLDHKLPSFVLNRTSVQWAGVSLFVALARLADPNVGDLAGGYDPGNSNNLVGPFNEQDKRLRDLLSLVVRRSYGGAWISTECAVVDESITHKPCWTILEYGAPLQSAVAQAAEFLKTAR